VREHSQQQERIQRDAQGAEQEAREARERCQELEKQLALTGSQAEQLQQELEAARRDREQFRIQSEEALRNQEDLQRELVRIQKEAREQSGKNEELREERGRTRAELSALRGEIQERTSEADTLREQAKGCQQEVRQAHLFAEELQEKIKVLELQAVQVASLEAELETVRRKLDQASQSQEDLEHARSEAKVTRLELVSQEEKQQSLVNQVASLEVQIEDQEEALRDSHFHYLQAKSELEVVRQELQESLRQREQLGGELEDVNLRRAALEEEFDALLSSQEGRSVADIEEELTRLSRQGESYRMRVADLGTELQRVRSRAEEAVARADRIEAALGAAEMQRREAAERARAAEHRTRETMQEAEQDRESIQRIVRFQHELVENMVAALVMIDPHGFVTLFNPAAEELFEQRAEAVLGHPYREIPGLDQLLPEIRRGLSGRSIRGGYARLTMESGTLRVRFTVVRLDVGGSRRCVLSLAPLLDEDEGE
jgi:chromosome segregation ATPase